MEQAVNHQTVKQEYQQKFTDLHLHEWPKEATSSIGQSSVDIFPRGLSFLAAHGLNYVPRPVFQNYSAYTKELDSLNATHLKSAKAPDWLIFNGFSAIDERYTQADAPATYKTIIAHYSPDEKFLDDGLLLLKKNTQPTSQSSKNIKQSTVKWGEWVTLDPIEQPLYMSAKTTLNTLGKLRTTLYKQPIARLVVETSAGETHTFKTVPDHMDNSFLLSPFLGSDLNAFAQYLKMPNSHGKLPRVVRFKFVSNETGLFEQQIPIVLKIIAFN